MQLQIDHANHVATSRIKLRLIATTDLHATLWPYDYLDNKPVSGRGLAVLANTIADLRKEASNAIVVDNGDTLEGTPLADLAVASTNGINPMIDAMNVIGYDAAVPGNHDFNFGLDSLSRATQGAKFPFILSNFNLVNGDPIFPRSVVLTRQFRDDDGAFQDLKIGLVGLAPPQTVDWDEAHLAHRLRAEAMLPAAQRELRRLRDDEKVDLTIALCHSGIDHDTVEDEGENVVVPLAATGLADAIVAGHTHERFPLQNGSPGTINGVPVVQPGAFGGDVGVIDLHLASDRNGRWAALVAKSRLVSAQRNQPDAKILARTERAHKRTLQALDTPIGSTTGPLCSYFDLFSGCCILDLLAKAQREAAREILRGHSDDGLPILSAVGPLRPGGTASVRPYTDIRPGPLSLRHVFDIYPFANRLIVLKLTGSGIRSWLEHSAQAFNTIMPGKPEQKLVDVEVADYAFDVMSGASYEIDVTCAPLSRDPNGPGRIRDLKVDGKAVRDSDTYLVVTNSYRAGGGGGYEAPRAAPVVASSELYIRDLLADHIRRKGEISPKPICSWRFADAGGVPVIAETGAGAVAFAKDVKALGLHYAGLSEAGLACFDMKI
ncbi:MAG: 5'-nucleotidase C-terminal domain-containing protein [Pseudomonadota bacterium]